jgi:anti-sigma B factor antagonist
MTSIDHVKDIEVLTDDGEVRVHVRHDITMHNSIEVSTEVKRAWEERGRPQRVILDLSGVRRIDSSGVGALMEISERTNRSGARLVLSGLEEAPQRLLERTGIIRLFEVRENHRPDPSNKRRPIPCSKSLVGGK